MEQERGISSGVVTVNISRLLSYLNEISVFFWDVKGAPTQLERKHPRQYERVYVRETGAQLKLTWLGFGVQSKEFVISTVSACES